MVEAWLGGGALPPELLRETIDLPAENRTPYCLETPEEDAQQLEAGGAASASIEEPSGP
jgi:hypothetical protein